MEIRKPTHEERIRIGDHAAAMLKDAMFNTVINALVRDNIVTLTRVSPGTPEGNTAHSSLNALEAIKNQLQALVNDAAVARGGAKK